MNAAVGFDGYWDYTNSVDGSYERNLISEHAQETAFLIQPEKYYSQTIQVNFVYKWVNYTSVYFKCCEGISLKEFGSVFTDISCMNLLKMFMYNTWWKDFCFFVFMG